MKMRFRQPQADKLLMVLAYLLLNAVGFVLLPVEYLPTQILYVVILSVAIMLIWASEQIERKNLAWCMLWCGIFVLGSVMAFRAQIGIDDHVYRRLFLRAGTMELPEFLNNSEIEIGYLLLNWFAYPLVGGNYDCLQALLVFSCFVLFALGMNKLRSYCSVSIQSLILWTHFYFLIMGGGLVRIFIAMAVIYFALHYIWESNWKAYVLCVLVASLFHISALMMLIFVVVSINEKWCYKYWFVLVAAVLVIMPLVFLFIGNVLAPVLGERYSRYTEIGEFRFSIKSLDTLPVWLVGLYYCYRYAKGEEKKIYIVGLVLISLSMIFSIYSTMVSLGRLTFYGNMGIMIISAAVCSRKPQNKLEYLVPAALIAYEVFYMLYTGAFNPGRTEYIFPYASFIGVN